MGDVATFAGLSEAVAFDRAGEDDCGRAAMIGGGVVGGVDFERVVSAESHAPEGVVGHVIDHAKEARIDTPEMLADVAAAGHGVLLILTVYDLTHALDEKALVVARKELVPL